jgi:hypothetical protein
MNAMAAIIERDQAFIGRAGKRGSNVECKYHCRDRLALSAGWLRRLLSAKQTKTHESQDI